MLLYACLSAPISSARGVRQALCSPDSAFRSWLDTFQAQHCLRLSSCVRSVSLSASTLCQAETRLCHQEGFLHRGLAEYLILSVLRRQRSGKLKSDLTEGLKACVEDQSSFFACSLRCLLQASCQAGSISCAKHPKKLLTVRLWPA